MITAEMVSTHELGSRENPIKLNRDFEDGVEGKKGFKEMGENFGDQIFALYGDDMVVGYLVEAPRPPSIFLELTDNGSGSKPPLTATVEFVLNSKKTPAGLEAVLFYGDFYQVAGDEVDEAGNDTLTPSPRRMALRFNLMDLLKAAQERITQRLQKKI